MEKAGDHIDINKLSKIAETKEKELREVKSLQVTVLQKDLDEKSKFLKLERARFQCLKRDFEYNLNIIEQRDAELLRYEKMFAALREKETLNNAELSDLKITTEDLRSKLEQSDKEKIELERYYSKRINDLKLQMNHFLVEKTKECQQEKDEYLKFRKNAERRIQESENEMETQKRQLMLEFDEEMAKKDSEFRLKLDDMENALHSKEITIKMVAKEVEILRDGSNKVVEEKGELGDQITALKKEVSQKDWEIQDIENMAKVKLNEIKEKLDTAEKEKHNLKKQFNRGYSDLDKMLKTKEQQLKALQSSFEQREESLKSEIEKLCNDVSKAENILKQSTWDFNDRLKERDLKITGLENVLSEVESKAKIEYANFTQAIIARDLEIEGLKSSNQDGAKHIHKLRSDIKELKDAYEKLKEHEILLMQSKEELELQWQKRYEDASQNAEVKYQTYIDGLQQKLSSSEGELENRQSELSQRESLVKVLTRDRDIAYSLLKKNGIELSGLSSSFNELVPRENFDSLMQQNEQLKNLLGVMRREIESIEERHTKDISQASLQYANDLEIQVTQLKTDKRRLENLVYDLQEEVHETKNQKRVTFIDDALTKGISESKQKLLLKLKSAAKQIQDLFVEQDRLQSVGNRLRNEVTHLKKQLGDKGAMEDTTGLITGNDIKQHVDLQNLESLHYQLAMRELKERPRETGKEIEIELASSSESSGLNAQTDFIDKTGKVMQEYSVNDLRTSELAGRHGRISSTPADKARLENLGNELHRVNITSSSELSSLQDLWKILDEAESLASQTPRSIGVPKDTTRYDLVAEKEHHVGQKDSHTLAQIKGHHMALQPKDRTKDIKLSKLAQGKFVPSRRPLKIRNYNVKDDQ